MKLVNCILFASLALGSTLAHAEAACTANGAAPLTVNRERDIKVYDGTGAEVKQVTIEQGSQSSR
jgi:hypothetical protein